MAHCVNRSSQEFKELAEQININPIILAAKVSLWQESNGLDKFPTIQDLKLIKPGVPELFDSIPELANAVYEALGFNYLKNFDGNINMLASDIASNYDGAKKASDFIPEIQKDLQQAQQLYSQYLDTIFPDSKVKDIVYHGTPKTLDKIEDRSLHFSTSIKDAQHFSEGVNVYAAIINHNNPVISKTDFDNASLEDFNNYEKQGTFIGAGFEHVVMDSKKVHILGSKQNLEGFKEFVNNQNFSVLFQKQNTESSTASKETLERMKEAAKKMGIDIKSLAEYVKGNPEIETKGINGLADLIQKVVAIATGKEGVALTEEIIHIATAMLEVSHPELITQMISRIGRYKIYDKVLKEYREDKRYQLPNGKPDIRKIKKEAVDKLLAEIIIKQNEGDTEFPELLEKENVSMIEQWWQTIKDFISSLYYKAGINVFEDVASKIQSGEISGETNSDEIYLQKVENKELNEFYDKVMDNAKRTKKFEADPNNRHYTFDGQRVATTVSTKAKSITPHRERTPEEKIIDDQKMAWGLSGHKFVEDFVKANLIDDNGFRKKEFTNTPIVSTLPSNIQNAVKSYLTDLVASYPDGTRFMVEVMQTNTKVKGLISSTVDFKAFVPNEKTGFKVDTLDWKFTTHNESKSGEDISWYKSGEWKTQMGEYNKMDYSLGLKPNQVGKSRMIPFILNYSYKKPGDSKSGLYPSSIQIADFKNLKETKTYLLPVATLAESTGNEQVDELVSSLSAYYDKLRSKAPSKDVLEQELKREELNHLSSAIKRLHISLDFSPLKDIAKNFLNRANRTLKQYIEEGFEKSSSEEIENVLANILEIQNSLEKFLNLDEIFLGDEQPKNLTKTVRDELTEFEEISASTKRLQSVLEALQANGVVELVAKKGLVTQEEKESLKEAQVEMQTLSKTFNEGTKLSNNLLAIASSLNLRMKSLVARLFSKKIDEISPAILELEKIAKAQGKKAFDLIGTSTGKLSLIYKLSKKFIDERNEAIEKKNKKFFLENMDVEKYNNLAKEYLKRKTEEIEAREYSGEEEDVYWIKQNLIQDAKNSVLINSESFNGYDSFIFKKFFKECLNEEKHLSEEYKKMSQIPSALAVWNYLTDLNKMAKNMGYKSVSSSFFPLMEATMLAKISQSKDVGAQMKDFFTDFYVSKASEEHTFSKLDPETNKLKLEIPKLFTRTDKKAEQLSTDLSKVISFWTYSLMDYSKTREMESTLLSLQQLNQSRGHLITDPATGSVIAEAGKLKVDYEKSKDDELFQAVVEDVLYKMGENLNSFGNLQLGKLGNKLGKTQEDKEAKTIAAKKIVRNADKLVQALAVGLKPLVALPNAIGVKLQSFINAGEFYKFREFEKNSLKAFTKIPLLEKALLHTFLPLNENLATEKQRELAKKEGLGKWLSSWSFMDVMMSTNAFPERRLQIANALSFFDNTTVINGQLVNIRQYIKKQDQKEKYKPGADVKAIEKSFESRVKEMKEKQSLSKIAKFENDKLTIPGIAEENLDEQIALYRTKVVEYSRNLTGQMNIDNKANYRRDTIFRSFMMFKNWIPKQLYVRGGDLKINRELDNWEYGRTRAFLKIITTLGMKNISQMREIIQATPKGLKILDDILEEKKQEHFRKTGEELKISKEEFYDLMRTQITNQAKELSVLIGLFGLFLVAKAAQPPDDADELTKNQYKWWMKLTNKAYDEVGFYYNPLSFDSITKGSITPSLGILVKTSKFLTHLGKLGAAEITGDEKDWDNAHPTKYFLNMIPIASQFNNDILPYIYPELAKEEGIKVTEEARQR